MNRLGSVCVSCHKKALKTYPNEIMTQAVADFEQSLKTGSLQDKGRALGVMAYAKCHSSHRLAYDAEILLNNKKS